MSDLINKMKEYLLDNKTSSIPEIKFLQESDLIFTLNRGFTELYRAKPKIQYYFYLNGSIENPYQKSFPKNMPIIK